MQNEALKILAVGALEELKGQDIIELDVAALTSVTDTMVIANGTSTRHVGALAGNVVEKAKGAGIKPLGVEGGAGADWVLVDLGDVVVHVMLPDTRRLYDLERLWSDLPGNVEEEVRGEQA